MSELLGFVVWYFLFLGPGDPLQVGPFSSLAQCQTAVRVVSPIAGEAPDEDYREYVAEFTSPCFKGAR